jgi:hypothetical protein
VADKIRERTVPPSEIRRNNPNDPRNGTSDQRRAPTPSSPHGNYYYHYDRPKK